jgi:hypothetical protein
MTTDYRALCAELTAELEFWSDLACKPSDLVFEEAEMLDLIKRARAALAQPEPVGANAEELAQLIYEKAIVPAAGHCKTEAPPWVERGNSLAQDDARECARAVFVRWGRPAIAPIPVSERLPGPEDCDAEGTCWMWHPVNFHYCLCRPDPSVHTHWLPFHALPLPKAEA